MKTFLEWLSFLNRPTLDETYYGLNPTEYNTLFDQELEVVLTGRRSVAAASDRAVARLQLDGLYFCLGVERRVSGST